MMVVSVLLAWFLWRVAQPQITPVLQTSDPERSKTSVSK